MKTPKSQNILSFVRDIGRPVFTTHELIALSGKSASSVTQSLGRLAGQGLLFKIYRGVWAQNAAARQISPWSVIPHLFSQQRVYVSFISALHLHGIIEQIPQVITLAALSHSRTLKTGAGVYSVHQLAASFFGGFDWYKESGEFLIAGPEKALIDSLYLSSRRKKQFGFFPELRFPAAFSFNKAAQWGRRIPEKKIRVYVLEKLSNIAKMHGCEG